jgi:DNA-binding response OmpR family regulator
MGSIARVLILSRDSIFLRMVSDYLARQDFEIVEYSLVASAGPTAEVIIADVDGLSSNMWQRVTELRRLDPSVALILATSRWPSLSRMHAWRPCGYLRKPFSKDDMLRVVRDLVTRRSGWPQEEQQDRQVQSGRAAIG